jgi:hypothetical protein
VRFEPIGTGIVAPKSNEVRGWRVTVFKGKLYGQTLWVKSNTPNELTVRDKGPSLTGPVEGDVLMLEEIDPNVPAVPTSRRDDVQPLVV